MRSTLIFGAAAAALLALGACDNTTETAANDTMTTPDGAIVDPAAAPPADVDAQVREAQDFVNAAGQANLAEIRTAEMALERASSADVKAYAQSIIDEHKAAGEQLKQAASAAALAPPPETLDDFHMRRINDLNETDGDADFDADFMALQVDAHNDAIDLFKDYAQDGDIAQLKSFASNTLPKLEEHKTKAETLNDAVRKEDKPG
jgi:putative membrane protein